MLIDIDEIEDRRVETDVCIIGAGAAGIAIANELAESGLRVVVLEAGRGRGDSEAQRTYKTELLGLSHGGTYGLRFRGIGGSTVAWAGQLAPLDTIDFARRDWIADSGWPLDRAALEPHYRRMAELLAVPPFAVDGAFPEGLSPAGLDSEGVTPYYTVFAPEPDFSKVFSDVIERSQTVTFVAGAHVLELVPDAAGHSIDLARVASFGGAKLDVSASTFVVCGGGVESARLLLVSTSHSEVGIGNADGLVGRFFQDHPGVAVGVGHPRSRSAVRSWAPRRVAGLKYGVRARISDDLQRAEGLGNASIGLYFDHGQSPSVAAGKLLLQSLSQSRLRREVPRALGTVARRPLPLVRAAGRYARGQSALDTAVDPLFVVGGEQVPNPESKLVVLDDRDELGVPKLALDWQLTSLDLRSYRRAAEVGAEAFERAGICSVDLDDFRLPDDPAEISGRAVDAGHHMGTTRMATTPEAGVVDPNCKVFGVDNLYVASCSVFPTSGTSNPTFTMLALALRLAGRLRDQE